MLIRSYDLSFVMKVYDKNILEFECTFYFAGLNFFNNIWKLFTFTSVDIYIRKNNFIPWIIQYNPKHFLIDENSLL